MISIGTTKKVLKELRFRAGDPLRKTVRPIGPTAVSSFIPKSTSKAGVKHVQSQMNQMQKVATKPPTKRISISPGAVIIPRERPDLNVPEQMKSFFRPREIALHETGHSADRAVDAGIKEMKKLSRKALRSKSFEETLSTAKKLQSNLIQGERTANKLVMDSIGRHGSPVEVGAWKKFANHQMKVGYRKPIYDEQVAMRGISKLSEAKDMLKEYPHLRGKNVNLEALRMLHELSKKMDVYVNLLDL